VDTVMTQYGFKNELNRLRTAGVDSVMKEWQQLHTHRVVSPKAIKDLSEKEMM
jgi:hypothetical protein